eukprot:COSAG01_NODE_47791_length_387_cov_0.541667_1_plen_118_part_01
MQQITKDRVLSLLVQTTTAATTAPNSNNNNDSGGAAPTVASQMQPHLIIDTVPPPALAARAATVRSIYTQILSAHIDHVLWIYLSTAEFSQTVTGSGKRERQRHARLCPCLLIAPSTR